MSIKSFFNSLVIKLLYRPKRLALHSVNFLEQTTQTKHSVLRVVLTFNISNIKKEGGFDSKIFVGIMWYTQFFPLSAPPKSLV